MPAATTHEWEAAAPPGPASTARNRTLELGLRAVPVAVVVVLGWTHRWLEEDAFLNFRIVDQIHAGHGPVFNIGQRVEVATSPMWLAMLTIARTVLPFVKLEYLALVGGLVLTGVGFWWVQAGAARLWRSADRREGERAALLVPVGAVVLAALPASWEWATSGLENGLSVAWIGALMLVLATVARREPPRLTTVKTVAVGVLFGLGPLVRPDLTIMSVAVIVALLVARRSRGRELAWFLAGAATLPVLSELFRMGYYGILVPNTALAKDAGGTYWSQGWNYLFDFLAPYWLWVPLLGVGVLAVLMLTRAPGPSVVVALALPVAGVLHALFIVKSGGDYLHARLLMPSAFALVAPFAALPWSRRVLAPIAVVGVWALVALALLRPEIHQGFVPLTEHDVAEGRELMTNLAQPGHRPVLATDFIFTDGPLAKRLQARGERALVTSTAKQPILDATPSRTTLLSLASGISGYRAGPDVLVHEYNSLADPVGSHMPPNPDSSPGHRKRKGYPWVFALTTKPGVTGGFDAKRVAAARAALACGALRDLVESTEAPMSAGRFWSNLTGAVGRTRLVVPRDEFAAEEKFCGHPGTISR
jgi:arabinofuranosyltransferase